MEKMAEPTGAGALAISGIVTAQGNAMRARIAGAAGRWHGAAQDIRLSKELWFNCKAQETKSSHWSRCLAGGKYGVAAVVWGTISLSPLHVS